MFYSGSVSDGVAKALQEKKFVVAFVTGKASTPYSLS